ncbi:MAG: hypothetical protein HOY69_22190 [Streptomyces sp.]|nr:hypothetical protein [Streptomyces sp.]
MSVPETCAAPQTKSTESPVTPPAGFRLVPALIGRPGTAQHVWLPCPEWCDQDHANERQVAVEDVWHSGPYADLNMPHREGSELLAYFRLGLDPYSSDPARRRPFVFAEDGFTANGRYMDAGHVESMCDEAEAAIARLRAMAQAVRVAPTL